MIKLVKCFKDDPEFIEPIDRDHVKSLPNSHPAMEFINGLSSDQFKVLADAAAYLRARRLVDCLVDAVMHRSELKRFYATVKIVD
uniref:DDE_Tnp_1_7 domain-containing protein n=1 Tax=Panagrellus redivivus TaxID=6233 RepID=A0A7E4W703_PANRE